LKPCVTARKYGFLLAAVPLLWALLCGFAPQAPEALSDLENCRSFLAQQDRTARPLVSHPREEQARIGCTLRVAEQEIASGHLEEARELIRATLERYPRQPDLLALQGYALLLQGDSDGARQQVEEAIEERPDAAFYALLGRILYDGQRLHEAAEALEQASELAPEQQGPAVLLHRVRTELALLEGTSADVSHHFQIRFDASGDARIGRALTDVLEEAYNLVGADLNFYPEVRIPVMLVTREHYRVMTDAPDWSGGLYDGKIRIPVGGLFRVDDSLRAVLFHEYTHAALRYMAGRIPQWLGEGLAQVQEGRFHALSDQVLLEAVRQGELLSFEELSGSWKELPASRAALAYQQSHSLVRYMLSVIGWSGMEELLKEMARGREVTPALAMVLEGFGMNPELLLRQWRESLPRREG